VIRILQYFQSC